MYRNLFSGGGSLKIPLHTSTVYGQRVTAHMDDVYMPRRYRKCTQLVRSEAYPEEHIFMVTLSVIQVQVC